MQPEKRTRRRTRLRVATRAAQTRYPTRQIVTRSARIAWCINKGPGPVQIVLFFYFRIIRFSFYSLCFCFLALFFVPK